MQTKQLPQHTPPGIQVIGAVPEQDIPVMQQGMSKNMLWASIYILQSVSLLSLCNKQKRNADRCYKVSGNDAGRYINGSGRKTADYKQAAICYNQFSMTQEHFIQLVLTISSNQPLIGIPFEENGQEVVRYFAEETQADQAMAEDATQTALQLAGAWSDLDWDEMERELDRIRHQSTPTPPIELDL